MTAVEEPTWTVVEVGGRRVGVVGPVLTDIPGVAYTLHQQLNAGRVAAGLPPVDATHVVPAGGTHEQAVAALRAGGGPGASSSGFVALRGTCA